MKRIISLGLAALILLGTLTGVLMSAAYATVGDSTSSSSGTDDNETGGKPNILTSDGILIESYSYSQRTLTLTLVDTNVSYQKGKDTFDEFYAALLTGNFYAKDSSTFTAVDWIEAPTGEKNLRILKLSFKTSSSMEKGRKPSSACTTIILPPPTRIFTNMWCRQTCPLYPGTARTEYPRPRSHCSGSGNALYPGAKLQLWRFGRGGRF